MDETDSDLSVSDTTFSGDDPAIDDDGVGSGAANEAALGITNSSSPTYTPDTVTSSTTSSATSSTTSSGTNWLSGLFGTAATTLGTAAIKTEAQLLPGQMGYVAPQTAKAASPLSNAVNKAASPLSNPVVLLLIGGLVLLVLLDKK